MMPSASDLFIFNVKRILKQKDMSQSELAQKAGMPGPQLSNYLNKKMEPGLERLESIAKALETPIASLFADPRVPQTITPTVQALLEALQYLNAELENTRLQSSGVDLNTLKNRLRSEGALMIEPSRERLQLKDDHGHPISKDKLTETLLRFSEEQIHFLAMTIRDGGAVIPEIVVDFIEKDFETINRDRPIRDLIGAIHKLSPAQRNELRSQLGLRERKSESTDAQTDNDCLKELFPRLFAKAPKHA